MSAEWLPKCRAAYNKTFPEGLSPNQKQAREAAIYEQLGAIAEDPERTQSPALRMKAVIADARKVKFILLYICH